MKSKDIILAPVHPGEILKEEFMVPLGLNAHQLSLQLRVPPQRITSIINGKRAITPDTAMRLSRLFGTTAEFWLSLQQLYELQLAKQKLSVRIDKEVHPLPQPLAKEFSA